MNSRSQTRIMAATLVITIICITLTIIGYLKMLDNQVPHNDTISITVPQNTPVTPEVPADADYYTVIGPAIKQYTPKEGQISYCELDELNRSVCAYGLLTTHTRDDAQERGRQDINVDPAGWPDRNLEVDIENYHGWFWNRSHLLADSLGGGPDVNNLVTGTRTQNVGANKQHNGGMAYTETIARNYLDNPANASCPLYYAATPVYTNTELIPRTVIVDIESCDKAVSQRVIVSNTARGWNIDYTTGEITRNLSQ